VIPKDEQLLENMQPFIDWTSSAARVGEVGDIAPLVAFLQYILVCSDEERSMETALSYQLTVVCISIIRTRRLVRVKRGLKIIVSTPDSYVLRCNVAFHVRAKTRRSSALAPTLGTHVLVVSTQHIHTAHPHSTSTQHIHRGHERQKLELVEKSSTAIF
jgi:hypothetical protein